LPRSTYYYQPQPESTESLRRWRRLDELYLEKQRSEMVKFARETDAPLKQYTIDNPFFGTLNAYHWLIYAPLHTMRHDKQIAEVKATAGYPK
jgi:hypothetical protein